MLSKKNKILNVLLGAVLPTFVLTSCSQGTTPQPSPDMHEASTRIHGDDDARLSNTKFKIGEDFFTTILNINLQSYNCTFKICVNDNQLVAGKDYKYTYNTCQLQVYGNAITTQNLSIDVYLTTGKIIPETFFNIDDKGTLIGFKKETYIDIYDTISIPTKVKKIGAQAFAKIFKKELCHITSLFLNEGLTEIDDLAFSDCTGLDLNLVLPSTLKRIGNSAFYGCSNLYGSISFPDEFNEIGDSAFFSCTNLSGDLIFNQKFQNLGNNAFENCENLDGIIKFSESLKTLGTSCFANCKKINWDFIVPQEIKQIPHFIFYNCESMRGKLSFPEQVISVGNYSFFNCKLIDFGDEFGKNITSIGDFAFSNCVGLTKINEMPRQMRTLGREAFSNCINLQADLNLPETLEHIGESCFKNCYSLNSKLSINSKLKIDKEAFFHCTSLPSINTLNTLIFIGDNAFKNCVSMELDTKLFKCAGDLSRIGDSAFDGCCNLSLSIDFSDSQDLYIGPLAFNSVKEITGSSDNNYIVNLGPIKKINTKSFYKNFSTSTSPISTFRLSPLTEEVGISAFEDCTRLDIFLPDYKQIPALKFCDSAFKNCHGARCTDDFNFYTFPEGLTEIGDSAFMNVFKNKHEGKYIDTINFPLSLNSIGNSAFAGCSAIDRMNFLYKEIPAWLKNIQGNSKIFDGLSNSSTAKVALPQISSADVKKEFLKLLKNKCGLPSNWTV